MQIIGRWYCCQCGISFMPYMYDALVRRRKNETRRFVKAFDPRGPLPKQDPDDPRYWRQGNVRWKSRFGKPGDRLYVQEATFSLGGVVAYQYDEQTADVYEQFTPGGGPARRGTIEWTYLKAKWAGMYMQSAAARAVIEVSSVCFERLEEIGHHSAIAEGIVYDESLKQWGVSRHDKGRDQYLLLADSPREAFMKLWDTVNPGPTVRWSARKKDLVCVVGFRLLARAETPFDLALPDGKMPFSGEEETR